jgi:hypothetical protein
MQACMVSKCMGTTTNAALEESDVALVAARINRTEEIELRPKKATRSGRVVQYMCSHDDTKLRKHWQRDMDKVCYEPAHKMATGSHLAHDHVQDAHTRTRAYYDTPIHIYKMSVPPSPAPPGIPPLVHTHTHTHTYTHTHTHTHTHTGKTNAGKKNTHRRYESCQ